METQTDQSPETVPETLARLEAVDGLEDEYDLPELAETMEDADARASASSFLFVLRNIKRDLDANDAEFAVLQDFNRGRHVARQRGLIAQIEYLRERIRFLFGFMTVTGKKKSLNLLGGRVGRRAKRDELVVDDDDEVIAWAEANSLDELVRLKSSIDRKALRAYVDGSQASDVPPPPGVRLEARDDEFFATPATD